MFLPFEPVKFAASGNFFITNEQNQTKRFIYLQETSRICWGQKRSAGKDTGVCVTPKKKSKDKIK